MKRLLLLLPLALAACTGETTTVTAPNGAPVASPASPSSDENGSPEQPASTVVVSPANMHGWGFYDDNTNGPCLVSGRMVFGPATPPLGVGSAELMASE